VTGLDVGVAVPMGSGAWIDPADPALELATARDGTAVQLRRLRRDEWELVAGVDGQCVGIARWIALADEPGTAEVAVPPSRDTGARAPP
jgi:hypothetical protein